MAIFVSDGKIAFDLTKVYASASAGTNAQDQPPAFGLRVRTNAGSEYLFARCQSDCSQYDFVAFGFYGDSASATPIPRFVPITTTNIAALGSGPVGCVQVSVASSYGAWVCMESMGAERGNVLIACEGKVPLYTTGTAGKLDDTTVSAGYVIGVVIGTSATSASAPQIYMNAPHVGAHA